MTVTRASPPVREWLILICGKCGKKLREGDKKNPSRQLAAQCKQLGDKRDLRAVVTGCMNLCPKKQIAMAIFHLKSHTHEFLTVKQDREDITEQLRALLDELR